MSWKFLLPAGVLAVGIAAVHGQQPKPAASQGSIPVFTSDTRLVVCHTTVVDKSGKLITNLKQDAFTVFENDAKQDILLFKREDIPVSMGLIIDNSGSMRPKRASVEAAALALVKDSNPDDEVFIVNFNDDAYIDNPDNKDFLTDIDKMKEALTRIDSRGGTAMRDAIGKSIEWLKKAHKEKKVLVVVTDGVDNASTESLEDLVREARQSDVLIYSVGLLTDEEKRSASSAKRQLNALAEATGGLTYYPKEVSEVDPIAHQVARDIRSQYTIAYKPSNDALDGTYRKIRIVLKAPGNLTPRSRTGYYATAEMGGGKGQKSK
jgi:VWFA-related protein